MAVGAGAPGVGANGPQGQSWLEPADDTEHTFPRAESTVGKLGLTVLGAANGVVQTLLEHQKTVYLSVATGGVYAGYKFWSGVGSGAVEGGILHGDVAGGVVGAVNSQNPLYGLGRGVAETILAAQSGDWVRAGGAGATTLHAAAVGVVGAALGAGSSALNGVRLRASLAAQEASFADLAQVRAALGLAEGEGTLARLDIDGQSFYGRNAHGQTYPRPPGVTFQSLRHAEGDAFGQAARAGISGGEAMLYVDRIVCGFCKSSLRGYARQLRLDQLIVHDPGGPFVVTP